MSFSDELYHYGVKGMKWGVRRTPEQLGHRTSAKLKKAATSVSKKIEDQKKQREAKRAVSLAKKKKAYLASPTLLFKHRKMFEKSEIDAAMKQFEWEQKLYQQASAERKRGKEFANDALDYVDTAIRGYNTAAKLYNAYAEGSQLENRLPLVSNESKKSDNKKKASKKEKTVLEKLSEYASSMADEVLEDNKKRKKGSGK